MLPVRSYLWWGAFIAGLVAVIYAYHGPGPVADIHDNLLPIGNVTKDVSYKHFRNLEDAAVRTFIQPRRFLRPPPEDEIDHYYEDLERAFWNPEFGGGMEPPPVHFHRRLPLLPGCQHLPRLWRWSDLKFEIHFILEDGMMQLVDIVKDRGPSSLGKSMCTTSSMAIQEALTDHVVNVPCGWGVLSPEGSNSSVHVVGTVSIDDAVVGAFSIVLVQLRPLVDLDHEVSPRGVGLFRKVWTVTVASGPARGDEECCPSLYADNISCSVRLFPSNSGDWYPFVNAPSVYFSEVMTVLETGFHRPLSGNHTSSFGFRKNPYNCTCTCPSLLSTSSQVLSDPAGVDGDDDDEIPYASSEAVGPYMPPVDLEFERPASTDLESEAIWFVPESYVQQKSNFSMFIGVVSPCDHFDLRMAIRNSWMEYEEVSSGKVAVRFFVGVHHLNKQVNDKLFDEAITYGDVELVPYLEGDSLLTLKTLAVCIYATKNTRADFVMKTNDDTFVRVDAVLWKSALLNEKSVTSSFLFGLIESSEVPDTQMRMPCEDDKALDVRLLMQEFSGLRFPVRAYVISSDIARFVTETHEQGHLKHFQDADLAMGYWIEQFKNGSDTQVVYIHDKLSNSGGLCRDGFVVSHGNSPLDFSCVWDRFKRTGVAGCCRLIVNGYDYDDEFKPFVELDYM